jgi:endonuclease/exonuclease/phosphatase family metal-dependent hydrolase
MNRPADSANTAAARCIVAAPDSAPAPEELKIATYNIHGAIGRDGKRSVRRIVDVLAELDADIVALQEVPLGGTHTPDVLAHLSAVTGLNAAEGPTLDSAKRRFGNAVLSRFPIRAARTLDLSFGLREPRGALDADIACGKQLVRVVATHLGLSASERRHQIDTLLSTFDTPNLPVILLGDLNEWLVWGQPLRRLLTHFRRAPAPPTFPTRWPLFALDRIWVHPGEQLIDVHVHRSALARVASDHFPLVARVSGIGAHGRFAAAADFQSSAAPARDFRSI